MEREKILLGLERCALEKGAEKCFQCPYFQGVDAELARLMGDEDAEECCFERLMADALEELRKDGGA